MTTLVLVNPGAGAGEAAALRNVLQIELERHGRPAEFEDLAKDLSRDDLAGRLKRAVAGGVGRIISCGGDGTASLVAGAIIHAGLGQQLTLGLFPSGTANLLARELGMPVDWAAAAEALATSDKVAPLDAMRTPDGYAFIRIGAGLDAATIGGTTREAKQQLGRWAYLRILLRRIFRTRRVKFNCLIDGRRRRFRAVQVFLANAGGIANAPFPVGPDISPHDGVITLCAYDALTWWDYLTLGWKLLWRSYTDDPLVKFFPVRQAVQMSARPAVKVQIDGEMAGQTPIRVEVLPAAVRVLLPG